MSAWAGKPSRRPASLSLESLRMNGDLPLRTLCARACALAAVFLLAATLRASDEATLRAALDRMAGEWSGEVQIKAMDGFVLKTVAAARRVSWEGDTLVVESTLSDGSSEYVVVARQSIRLGRLESSVSRPSQPVDRYLGDLVGGALAWTNAEGNRRDARDQVAERAGSLLLETSSVEPIRAFGLSGLVRVEGKYRRPAPPVAAGPVETRPAAGPDPALASEVESLRRSLEEERASSAAQRTRAEQAERRATEAEGRAQALETDVVDARASASRLAADLEQARQEAARLETERASAGARLLALEAVSTGAARDAEAGAQTRRTLEARVAALETELAAATREREDLQAKVAGLEQTAGQMQRDSEALLAANQRLTNERAALEARAAELQDKVEAADARAPAVVAPVVAVAAATPDAGPSFSAAMREKLVAEVQQMERRVLELESERNTAREQLSLVQRQLEETRRLRDDTLLRFQTVVTELNAMREEKERLARANVSLQAEVRQAARPVAATPAGATPPAASAATPATTFDGKTADMIIAALQIIGVTRGDGGEDKAILDGRVYRNGDLVEAQLGITFVGIDGNSLVFQDRRGREYRRRF
jgi:hypothetical protein